MFIPFLPKLDAQIILEQFYQDEEDASLIEAEIGSSYFMSGLSSWDASAWARHDRIEREAAFRATSEGGLYFAKVEAAQFMESVITADMRARMASDPFCYPVSSMVVPEYYPYDVTGNPTTPPEWDICRTFTHEYGHIASNDDLPF